VRNASFARCRWGFRLAFAFDLFQQGRGRERQPHGVVYPPRRPVTHDRSPGQHVTEMSQTRHEHVTSCHERVTNMSHEHSRAVPGGGGVGSDVAPQEAKEEGVSVQMRC